MSNVEQLVPDDESLASVSFLIHEVVRLEDEVEAAEADLKQLKAQLQSITHNKLPLRLSQLGANTFKTNDGLSIKTYLYGQGGLPKTDTERQKAFALLEDMGAGPIIKAEFSAAIEKGRATTPETKAAVAAVRKILGEIGVDLAMKFDVHPQTLYAFARERIEAGEYIPLDDLGIDVGRAVKVVR